MFSVLMNCKSVCKTAPDTLGLLLTLKNVQQSTLLSFWQYGSVDNEEDDNQKACETKVGNIEVYNMVAIFNSLQ